MQTTEPVNSFLGSQRPSVQTGGFVEPLLKPRINPGSSSFVGKR
jgi:hypothetical protein